MPVRSLKHVDFPGRDIGSLCRVLSEGATVSISVAKSLGLVRGEWTGVPKSVDEGV